MQAWGEGEIGEGADVVVCKIDCVLVLVLVQHVVSSLLGEKGGGKSAIEPLQRRDSQWRVFCGLHFSIMISMELASQV